MLVFPGVGDIINLPLKVKYLWGNPIRSFISGQSDKTYSGRNLHFL
jgi:hypothetical protein